MFVQACNQIHECIYGLMGLSQTGPTQVNATNGTGFMIAPGVLVTAGHFCHIANDPLQPIHTRFQAIRSPEIGQHFENATLIATDPTRDIALLRIDHPRSASQVQLECSRVPTGTNCGSLGFPLSIVIFLPSGPQLNLIERFQGASISTYHTSNTSSGRTLGYYETDALMYSGSSGCPGFLTNTRVFGMHVASITEPVVPLPSPTRPTQSIGNRLAISIWVPADEIRAFAISQGVTIQA